MSMSLPHVKLMKTFNYQIWMWIIKLALATTNSIKTKNTKYKTNLRKH